MMIEDKLTIRQAEEWAKSRSSDTGARRLPKTVVKDFRIVYNAFKETWIRSGQPAWLLK